MAQGNKPKKPADSRTLFVRIVALACALLIAGSAFGAAFMFFTA